MALRRREIRDSRPQRPREIELRFVRDGGGERGEAAFERVRRAQPDESFEEREFAGNQLKFLRI